ncbi:sulfotransferase family 2 domain-containing protein [Shimia sp. Alg240-R146]|uniref:sulfotransferase family 2 domain-containing protein n=1 Tax=Shimia sp. Alg240-R146 TaxID=2993449 RepID=UPI0022E3D7CB|nr:sulfotransferase family 2 domain-containing protein [Shimia sp. Alg240-R146]
MILSLEYNFIFLHVPKTAGQSLMAALLPFSRDADKKSLLRRFSRRLPIQETADKAHFKGHETARGFIRKLGRPEFDRFKTFGVVRNPYTHAVSHFEYMKQYRNRRTAEKVGAMTFTEYLEYRLKPALPTEHFFAHLPDQTHFVVDRDGKIAVDRLLRFETLDQDFSEAAEWLGLDGVSIARSNVTKAAKKPITDYFGDRNLALMHELYQRDFDILGYARDVPV